MELCFELLLKICKTFHPYPSFRVLAIAKRNLVPDVPSYTHRERFRQKQRLRGERQTQRDETKRENGETEIKTQRDRGKDRETDREFFRVKYRRTRMTQCFEKQTCREQGYRGTLAKSWHCSGLFSGGRTRNYMHTMN